MQSNAPGLLTKGRRSALLGLLAAVGAVAPPSALAQPVLRLVAAQGDPTSGGGTTTGAGDRFALGSSGVVTFDGFDTDGVHGLFEWSAEMGIRRVLTGGQVIAGDRVRATLDLLVPLIGPPDAAGRYPYFARGTLTATGGGGGVVFRRGVDGSTEILAESGEPCADDPGLVQTIDELRSYTDGGLLLVRAGNCPTGFVVATSDGLRLLPRYGDPVPGFPGATPPATLSQNPLDVRLTETGASWLLVDVACAGDPQCPSGHSVLLVRAEPGGSITPVLRVGAPAAGTSDGATYDSVEIASTNAVGDAALRVGLRGADGIVTPALYLARGATLELVARQGAPAPGLPGPTLSELAPGPPYRVYLADDGSVVFGSAEGIWRAAPGRPPTSVVRVGQPHPGGAPGTVRSLRDLVANPLGRVAFVAEIEGGPTILPHVVLAEASEGTFVEVARTDTPLDVGRPEPFEVPRALDFHLGVWPNGSGGFNARGQLLFDGSDGSTGHVLLADLAGPPQEVRLVGLEAVQTIQTLRNTVPLVAFKQTYVRAYLESDHPTNVRLRLRGRRGGVELDHSPYDGNILGASGFATPTPLSGRGILGGAFWFEVPPTWTEGDVELSVELHPESTGASLACRDAAGPASNDCSLTVRFERTPRIPVHWVQVVHGGGWWQEYRDAVRRRDGRAPPDRLPTTVVPRLREVLASILPVVEVDVQQSQSLYFGGELSDFCEMQSRVRRLRAESNCGRRCTRLWQGYTPILGGCAERGGNSSAAGYHDSGYRRHSSAHEIAHNLGLVHPAPAMSSRGVCGESADPDLPAFPYFWEVAPGTRVATIGPMPSTPDEQVWGLDLLGNHVRDPARSYELMSYCRETRWISDVSYRAALDAIRARFSTGEPEPGPSMRRYWIAGRVLPAHAVELEPISMFETRDPPEEMPPGPLSIELRDAAGAVLSTQSVTPGTGAPDATFGAPPPSAPSEHFYLTVPADDRLAAVVVRRDGVVVAEAHASASAPEVRITSPAGGDMLAGETARIEWVASDPDGDALTYAVSYSADGGASWQALAVEHPESSLELPRTALRGSTEARVRVVASDGVRVALADSETFAVEGSPPEPVIRRPLDGTLFVGDGPLFLTGVAWDPEDGELPAEGLEWSSDRDGALGTGSPLAVSAGDLSEGTHVVTLRATDSDRAAATAEITLRVARSIPHPLHDLVLEGETTPGLAPVGAPFRLVLDVANAGPDDAAATQVHVRLPPPLVWRAADPGQADCTAGAEEVSCVVPPVARGAQAELALSLEAPEGAYVAEAALVSSDADPFHVNDRTEVSIVVSADAPAPSPEGSPDDPGCGCSTAGAATRSWALWLLGGVGAAALRVWRRWRRRSRAAPRRAACASPGTARSSARAGPRRHRRSEGRRE